MESSEIDSITTRKKELREGLDLLQDTWSDALINQDAFGRMQDSDIYLMTEVITRCRIEMGHLYKAMQGPLRRAIVGLRINETAPDEIPVARDSNTLSSRSKEPVIRFGTQDKVEIRGSNLDISKQPSTSGVKEVFAGDSSTPSNKSEVSTTISEPQDNTEVKESNPNTSDQPITSGVKEGELNLRPGKGKSEVRINVFPSPSWQEYQSRWEKLCTRRGLNPSYCRVDIGGKYPRVWMLPGAKPHEVREWYEFGALASVYTMAPGFVELQDLPKWIFTAVYRAWSNNPLLQRGDVLELYFFSAAPEPAGRGYHEAFHFINLRRPDNTAFRKIKEGEGVSAVSTFTEEQISTRRAWGLWVCLTEMGKVKSQFKYDQADPKKELGSFMINTMTGQTSEYANKFFEKKRGLLWNNKIPGSEATHHKYCNMAHCNQWTDHICDWCSNQKEPEFGKGFGPRPDKRPARSSEHEEHRIPPRRQPRAPKDARQRK